MLSTGLKFFNDTPLTILAMLLFVLAFSIVSVWVLYRGKSDGFYKELSLYPLKEEEKKNV